MYTYITYIYIHTHIYRERSFLLSGTVFLLILDLSSKVLTSPEKLIYAKYP